MDEDVRLLMCSPAAQVIAFRLAARSIEGQVRIGSDAGAAASAICGGAAWAEQGLDELQAAGLVKVQQGVIILVWEWPVVGGKGSIQERRAGVGEPDDRSAVNRLRALWSKYNINTEDARIEWIDSSQGLRFLMREGRSREWAVEHVRTARRNRGRFGCQPAATTTATTHGDNRAPPPTPPTPEKSSKNTKRVETGTRRQLPTTDGNDNQHCPIVKASELFLCLRHEGGLELSITTTHQTELTQVLREVTPAWTHEGIERLARHIKAGHLRKNWRPTLQSLRGQDCTWSTLMSLYGEALSCSRCTSNSSADVEEAQSNIDLASLKELEEACVQNFRRAQIGNGCMGTPT